MLTRTPELSLPTTFPVRTMPTWKVLEISSYNEVSSLFWPSLSSKTSSRRSLLETIGNLVGIWSLLCLLSIKKSLNVCLGDQIEYLFRMQQTGKRVKHTV